MSSSLVVIDSRVANFHALIASLPAGNEYVVLDRERDGMVQIVEALAGKGGHSSIQIISHGAPGAITLGSTLLDSTALHDYSAELATIGSALLPMGDLMLYGCNVGNGDVGQQFVATLAQLTGADVAASDDLTGAATFGGDWVLEVQSGTIESVVQPIAGMDGVLTNSAPSLSVPTSDILFASTIDYTAGYTAQAVTANGFAPQAVIAADINGDNAIDLVIINTNSATVSVLMNNGNGSFAPKVDYSVGNGPHSVTVTDVNNDARPDLVVANNWTTPNISVLLNNGNGIFTSKVNYPAGADLYAVTSADINKDGWMDVIVTNASAGTITVLQNNGDGTFPTTTPAASEIYSTGASPLAIASADFNNDGFIDLVVPNSGNSKVSVLFNNGSGGFTEKTDYNTGADSTAIRPVSVIATDFNGDNFADIAVANFTSGNVSVLLNKGDGTFLAITSTPGFPKYPTQNHPASISATDINGDGKTDLVVANSGSNTVSVLLNNGDGTFAPTSLTFSAGFQPYAVTAADINNDNKNDIIVANINENELTQNRVSVLINTSSVAATSFTEQTAIAVCSNIVLTDSDGDASWSGGSLSVQVSKNAEAADMLGLPAVNFYNGDIWLDTPAGNIIMAGTTVIGAADAPSATSNSEWILTFNANATNALVQDVARSVIFNNSSDTPSELERVVTFVATDNLGAATSLEQRVAVTAVDETANTAPTFMPGDGKVTTDFGGSDFCLSVTTQNDGKILLAGYTYNSDNDDIDFALARYNCDGSLDTSFGFNGTITTSFGLSKDYGYSVTIQSDGKILVAGYTINFGSLNLNDFALARYNGDGSLDISFGINGKVTTDFDLSYDSGYSVTVQNGGKILVAGYSFKPGLNSSYPDLALVRYNSDGSLDTTFSSDGKVITVVDSGSDEGWSVAVQSDGKILAAAESYSDFALVRYNSDGSLDTSFSTDGKVSTDFGSNSDISYSVAVQSDGKILVAGKGSSDFALVRYKNNGSLDTTFSSDGKVTTAVGSNYDEGRSVTLQSDGKILVAGSTWNDSGNSDFALVRYNSDGSLDTTFSSDGKVITAFGSSNDLSYGVTVQSDGKILVAGYTDNGINLNDFAVVRYNSDGSLDTTFDSNILNGTPIYIEGGNAVVLDNDVQIFDAELAVLGNYGGATLVLLRNGGTSIDDHFFGAGIVAGAAGGTLTVAGTNVGHYTWVDGTLELTFNANATQAFVNQAMQSLAYENASDAPPASVQIDWTFSDSDSSGALSATGSTIVTIVSVADTTAPTLFSATPSDNAMSVPVGSDFILTFNENVKVGTGSIVISNGTDVRTIAVTDSSQVTFDGDKIIINPTDDLHAGSNYHVEIDNGAIKDFAGNGFAGISEAEALNFGTEVINSAPTSSDDSITMDEDTAELLSLTDFGSFADPDGTALAKVQITTLESAGALRYHGGTSWTDVTLNQEITAADITAGKLRFEPADNANGGAYATLAYKVSDGLLYSENAYTLTVNVSAVNDLPTVSGTLATTVSEGDSSISLNLLANAHDVDLTDTLSLGNVSYTINGVPSALPAGIMMNGTTLTIDPGNTDWNAMAQGEENTIVLTYQILDSAATAEISFATKVDYTTGLWPSSVTSADVNGDGKADLIVANATSNTVSVLNNNGDGTFATKVDYATGDTPYSVTSADVNGDGKADLIVANHSSDTLSVLNNNGDGTFATKVDYATGSYPESVTSADVNGDGKADLIVANFFSNKVSVLKNNGDGIFTTTDYGTGIGPCSVTSADVNGDGNSDLIVANGGSPSSVSVLINSGDGTFVFKVNYAMDSASSVTSADVNGDDQLDLIVANDNSNTVSVLINNGDGTFATKVDYTTGLWPSSVTSADVNGDGKADLIVANATSNTVSVLNNNGDGTVAAKVDYATGSYLNSVTNADVNGDGKPDLIHANATSNTVSVLINNSTGFIGYYPTTTAMITINGTNDAPVVEKTDVTGAVKELATPVGNLTDSGTINFTDVDLADTHTISSVTPSVGSIGTLTSTITTDTTGTGLGGVVTWNYEVAASAVEYLAEGEKKIETFTFSVLDSHGGHVELTVDVMITGTYDDTTSPALMLSMPSDDATAVPAGSDLVLTFSENVQAGTGNIVISDGTDIRRIDVTDTSQVTFDGETVTINPVDDLHSGSNYYVEMTSGVIQDMTGNAFAGINDAETLDFETISALSGHITFWKTGEAITDVTTTLTTLPTDGAHAIELKNIHVKADGSHTVEVWATTPNSSTGSFECEFVLPTGADATWQDAATLPARWTSTSNTIASGNFFVDGMSTNPLVEGQVKLGTLTITTQTEADNFELLLIGGQLGDNDVEGFAINSIRSATGNGNEYRYHSLTDGHYALTADKLAGAREASAVHANDALAALKMAVELNPNDDGSSVLPYQYLAADINQDGKVRANDALSILKMAVGIDTAPDNNWIFVSEEETLSATMSRKAVDWSVADIDVLHNSDTQLHLIGIVKGDVDGSWASVG